MAAPEAILSIGALILLMIDLGALRDQDNHSRRVICAMAACLPCLAAFFWMLAMPADAAILDGALVVNPLTIFAKQCLLLLTVATILISIQFEFTDHVGEFFAITLLATVAMMFL